MRSVIICILVSGLLAGMAAAQTARGVSQPGRLEDFFRQILSDEGTPETKQEGLVCTVVYEAPSGKQSLSPGETGTVTVLIKNNTNQTVHSPQLELSISSSWSPEPRKTVRWLDPIPARGSATFTSDLRWSEQLPAGNITYSARVMDIASHLMSVPADVTFAVSAKVTRDTAPVFVNVGTGIPRVDRPNRDAVAVVIGNSSYSHADVPDVKFAGNDAKVVKQYLINVMGYDKNNILLVENAGKAALERIFGSEQDYRGQLFNWVKPRVSDVFIFYSGHGAPDLQNRKSYFVPVDSDPDYVRITGYSLESFYKNISRIPARSMTVVLDACFSGASQEGMLIRDASPMYIDTELPLVGDSVNLIASASGAQIASWYPEGNHSLLTYYFLRALRGEADLNKDRKITLHELKVYLQENVPYMARRLYGREQNPTITGRADFVLSTY